MVKAREAKHRKETLSVTLPDNVLDWLDKKVEDRTYSSRSFAIEKAVLKLMEAEKRDD